MPSGATKLVRLKPYDPKRGHLLQRFMFAGHRFLESRGWYEVPAALAAQLEVLKQPPGRNRHPDDVPLAFDVVDKAEAKQIDKRESREKDRQTADEPVDLTTSDLHRDLAADDEPRVTRRRSGRRGS